MSKNIHRISGQPYLRIPVAGGPRLRGWAVRYVSGMEDDPEIKPGFWLSQWQPSPDRTSAKLNFEPELVFCFQDESEANAVASALRNNSDIETAVVRID